MQMQFTASGFFAHAKLRFYARLKIYSDYE